MTAPAQLKVIAVAGSAVVQTHLQTQLKAIPFIQFDHVVCDLAEAQALWSKERPDLLIIDLTGREIDACLFSETINYNAESKTIVFALHEQLDPTIIVKAVSSGVKEFIQYPQDADALTTALNKHWNLYQKRQSASIALQDKQTATGLLIPVYGSKGGVGASTIAVNLAHQLHAVTQEKVVLLDMDQVFSNTAVMLNFSASYAVADLVKENAAEIDDDLLGKIVVHHQTGVDLVVACKSVLDENPQIPPQLVERLMTYLRSQYAYVVVDLPTHVVDPYHQYFMAHADDILIVSSLDIPGLYRTRQYLDLIRTHLNMDRVKLILNRCDLKAAMGLSNDRLEAEFKYPVYARLPNNWNANVEAVSMGQVLAHAAPQSDLSQAFAALAVKLSGIKLETPAKGREPRKLSGGLLGRLTGRTA